MLEKGLIMSKYDQGLLMVDPLLLTEMELLLVRLLRFISDGGYHKNEKEIDSVQNISELMSKFTKAYFRPQNIQKQQTSQLYSKKSISPMINEILPSINQTKIYMFFNNTTNLTNQHQLSSTNQYQESKIENSIHQHQTVDIMGEKRTILQIKRQQPSQQLQKNSQHSTINIENYQQNFPVPSTTNQAYGLASLIQSHSSHINFSLVPKKEKTNQNNMFNYGNTNNQYNSLSYQPTIFCNQNNTNLITKHTDRKEQQQQNKKYNQSIIFQNDTNNNNITNLSQNTSFKRDSSGMNLKENLKSISQTSRQQELVRLATQEKEKITKKKIQKRKKQTRKLLLEEDQSEEGQQVQGDRKVGVVGIGISGGNVMGYSFMARSNSNVSGFGQIQTSNLPNINLPQTVTTTIHQPHTPTQPVQTITQPSIPPPFTTNQQPLISFNNNPNYIQQSRSVRLSSNKELDVLINRYNLVDLKSNNIDGNSNNSVIYDQQQKQIGRNDGGGRQWRDDFGVNKRVKNNQIIQGGKQQQRNQFNNTQKVTQNTLTVTQHYQHQLKHQNQQFINPTTTTNPQPPPTTSHQSLTPTTTTQHIKPIINDHNNQASNNILQSFVNSNKLWNNNSYRIDGGMMNLDVDNNIVGNGMISGQLSQQELMLLELLCNHPIVDKQLFHNYPYYQQSVVNHPYYKQPVFNQLSNQQPFINQSTNQPYQHNNHNQQTHHKIVFRSTFQLNSLIQQFQKLIQYQTTTIDEFIQFVTQKLFVIKKGYNNTKQQQQLGQVSIQEKQQHVLVENNQLYYYQQLQIHRQLDSNKILELDSNITLEMFLQLLKQVQLNITNQLMKQAYLFILQPHISLYSQIEHITTGKVNLLMNKLLKCIMEEFQLKVDDIVSGQYNSNGQYYTNDNNNYDNKNKKIKSVQEVKVDKLVGNQLRLYQLVTGYIMSCNNQNYVTSKQHMSNTYYNNFNKLSFIQRLNQHLTMINIDCTFNSFNKQPIETKQNNTLSNINISNQQQPINIMQRIQKYLTQTQTKLRQLQQIVNMIMCDLVGIKYYQHNYFQQLNPLITITSQQYNETFTTSQLPTQLHQLNSLIQSIQKSIISPQQQQNTLFNHHHKLNNNNQDTSQKIHSILQNHKDNNNIMVDQQQMQLLITAVQSIFMALNHIKSDVQLMTIELKLIDQQKQL